MAFDQALLKILCRRLSTQDDGGALGPKLVGDAGRLWRRLQRLLEMGLIGATANAVALELACYALQLPLRQGKRPAGAKLSRTSLRDRCEQAAELMVGLLRKEADEELLDQCARVLHETPQRTPIIQEARLLADAVNLDDFGVVGLVNQIIQIGLAGEGAADFAAALEKREQYGYWEARLKDSFHFEPVGQIARKRLQAARKVVAMLAGELNEDGGKL